MFIRFNFGLFTCFRVPQLHSTCILNNNLFIKNLQLFNINTNLTLNCLLNAESLSVLIKMMKFIKSLEKVCHLWTNNVNIKSFYMIHNLFFYGKIFM